MKTGVQCRLTFLLLTITVGCSSYRPVVDENEGFDRLGPSGAEKAIDDCMARADRYLEAHKSQRLKNEAGRGAVSGAVIGGIAGALTGNTRNALGGAAIGAGAGAAGRALGVATKDGLSPDELKQNYVARCLKRKNLVVIGWK